MVVLITGSCMRRACNHRKGQDAFLPNMKIIIDRFLRLVYDNLIFIIFIFLGGLAEITCVSHALSGCFYFKNFVLTIVLRLWRSGLIPANKQVPSCFYSTLTVCFFPLFKDGI